EDSEVLSPETLRIKLTETKLDYDLYSGPKKLDHDIESNPW
ncbi:unnamed protein product, partial [marine sediment metagenome]